MSGTIAAARRSVVAATIALLLGMGAVVGLPTGTARADTAPLDETNPATPATVSADPLPTVQINGVAWAQAVVGNTVYVTGEFTRARPAGAPRGTQEVVRNHLLAYDIRTGALISSFAPSLNAQGRALAASPDGSRIYVGGDFSTANGQSRHGVAAYSTTTGALLADFAPAVGGVVRTIATTGSTVYLGGDFSAVGGTARNRLAAVTAGGSLLPWRPQPGVGSTAGNRLPNNPAGNARTSNSVLALTVAGGQVIAAGRFDSLNGVKATGVGALDPVSGATRPFAVNQILTNQGVNSAIFSLSTDGSTVYGTGYDYYGPGNLEGSFAAAADTGALKWINECHGDTYSSFPMNGALYHATHAHVCSNIGSFPEMTPRVNMFGTAVSLAPVGRTGNATLANANLRNRPAPAVLPWWPTFYSGTYTGQSQAGWTVSGNSDYVVYGGEFPGVNGSEQQGLVRFAVRDLAPNKVAPRATGTFAPTVSMIPGAVRISWRAVSDRDNEYLTYRVYRDNDTSAPVCETTRGSEWWRLPTYACADTTAPAGSHRYLVIASDAFGNDVESTWVTATVGSSNRSGPRLYADLVRADHAQNHWPLSEPSGSTAYDRTTTQDMTINAGVSRGQTGAISGDADPAFRFNGTSNGFLSTRSAVSGPQRFSVEAWFQTTSRAGGKIVGFGNAQTGTSTAYDRQLFIDTAGRLHFGVNNGAARQVDTTTAYNDGRWHHVVGTLDGTGMAFYVDGALIGKRTDVTSAQFYSGFWRVGGDRNWSAQPYWFSGLVDEVAVYPAALTASQVAAHNAAGRSGKAPNRAPSAAFSAGTAGLTVSVDGSGAEDADGRIAGYAWNFGDGSTATGATASHSYSTAGTYTVRLTVTDDEGATATTTRDVTVAVAPTGAGSVASDAFERSVPNGWGTADRGGAWAMGGGSAVSSVTGGAGQLSGGIGRGVGATLGVVSASDVAVQADLTLVQAPTGGGTFLSLGGRRTSGTDYRATLYYRSTGVVELRLDRMVDGAETILVSQRLPGAYTAGSALTVRFEVEGSGLRAKAWAAGTAEPTAWTVTTTDSTAALQRPGGLFLEMYTSRSATRQQVIRVDNLRAEAPGTVVEPPAENAAPAAAFTATPAGMQVAVDGSGSTDGDGTVTGYSWNWGDGTAAGSGVTAAHTYAAAGDYTVTLTVTDDDGATGTTTRVVEVVAPAPGGDPLAADAFGRAVATGWGTADRGGNWTMAGGSAIASVSGGVGQLSGGVGRTVSATLADVSAAEVAVQADVTLVQAATGGGVYLALGGRKVGTTDYRATLRYQSTGVVDVRIDRTVNGVETVLAAGRLPGTYTAGTALSLRLEIDGAALRAKVWRVGTTEPTEPTVTATDTTAALQRPGAVFVEMYTASNATRAQVIRMDNLWVGNAGDTPPAP